MQTTEQFAAQIGLLPQSIRSQLCRSGSYYGVRPKKLPNGRLLWPDNAADLLVPGKQEGTE